MLVDLESRVFSFHSLANTDGFGKSCLNSSILEAFLAVIGELLLFVYHQKFMLLLLHAGT